MTTPQPKSDFGYPPQYVNIDVSSLRDVDLLGLADGNVLVWNESRELWDVGVVAGANELNDMTDVTLAGPSNGQVLTYNGALWVNATPTSGNLNSITDVVLTAPVSGEVLSYNGVNWVNNAIPALAINDLTDVSISSVATNEILAWTGTMWANTDSPTFDALTVTNQVTATTISDGTLSINASNITGAGGISAASLTTTGDCTCGGAVTGTSFSDGIVDIDGTGDINDVATLRVDDVKINTGTVTQSTSTTNPVTLNAGAGIITTVSSTLATDSQERFTVTCDSCVATSLILTNLVDYPESATGVPIVSIDNIAGGTFDIVVTNVGTSALNDVLKIAFVIH